MHLAVRRRLAPTTARERRLAQGRGGACQSQGVREVGGGIVLLLAPHLHEDLLAIVHEESWTVGYHVHRADLEGNI